MKKAHVLYRMFGHDGALLYVGITNSPKTRFSSHEAEKLWWESVANITLEHFNSREALVSAEKAAIETENPKFNRVHAKYSVAWCRAQGHYAKNEHSRCWDCQDNAGDLYLIEEYGDDPFLCSWLGLDTPNNRLSIEELRAHPRFPLVMSRMDALVEFPKGES